MNCVFFEKKTLFATNQLSLYIKFHEFNWYFLATMFFRTFFFRFPNHFRFMQMAARQILTSFFNWFSHNQKVINMKVLPAASTDANALINEYCLRFFLLCCIQSIENQRFLYYSSFWWDFGKIMAMNFRFQYETFEYEWFHSRVWIPIGNVSLYARALFKTKPLITVQCVYYLYSAPFECHAHMKS